MGTLGAVAEESAGVPPDTAGAGSTADTVRDRVHCLPISTPIKKRRMQSKAAQVAAMATIREVMVKTY